MVERISTRALAGRPSTRALGASIALTVAMLLLLPQVARAGGAIELPAGSNHETEEAVRWGFAIAIGVELILSLGFQFVLKVDVAKLFVGTDNRVSTSKTIAAVWTFVVAAALFAFVYANLLDHPGALEATNAGGRVGQYALLFGGPIGAAILSKAIVGGQVSSSSNAKTTAKSPALADLIANDSGESDLGDLQYVLFNFVALVFVLGMMLIHEPSGGLPHIPDVLLGLTSVSAVGYVGKKLLPPQAITAELDVSKGKAATNVEIAMTGVPKPAGPEASFWVRFGQEDKGRIARSPVSKTGIATLTVNPTPEPAPAALPVSVPVFVVTEGGAEVEAGKFTIEE